MHLKQGGSLALLGCAQETPIARTIPDLVREVAGEKAKSNLQQLISSGGQLFSRK